MRSSVVVSFAEAEWLQALISEGGPNLLIQSAQIGIEPVVTRLMDLCKGPIHTRQVPGPMNLPEERGTVVLWDVAELTISQQIELFDWISKQGADRQLISVTSEPLLQCVEEGRFLEGLLYRLNVISFSAVLRLN